MSVFCLSEGSITDTSVESNIWLKLVLLVLVGHVLYSVATYR